MLGLLHALPSALILIAVGIVVYAIQRTTNEQHVLGVETSVEFVKTETREDRIRSLEKSFEKSGSLEVKSQLDSLR